MQRNFINGNENSSITKRKALATRNVKFTVLRSMKQENSGSGRKYFVFFSDNALADYIYWNVFTVTPTTLKI